MDRTVCTGADSVRRWQVTAEQTSVRHEGDPSNQRCSKHRAKDAPDGTEGYSALLKGTGLLDGMRSSTRNTDHEPPRHEGDSSNQRCAANLVQTMHGGVVNGYSATGWHACKHTERRPCTVWHQHTRSTGDAHTLRRVALRGTQGCSTVLGCWTVSMQRAKRLVRHSLRACRVAAASVRRYATG